MTALTNLDWVILAIVVLSVFIGLWRGFSKELVSLLAWVAAFYVALNFSGEVSNYFEKSIPNQQTRFLVAIALIFLVIVLVGYLFNKILHLVLRLTGFGFFDRLLGMVFGLGRAVLVATAIFVVLKVTSYENADWVAHSYFAPYFQPLATHFTPHLPLEIQNAHSALNVLHDFTSDAINHAGA